MYRRYFRALDLVLVWYDQHERVHVVSTQSARTFLQCKDSCRGLQLSTDCQMIIDEQSSSLFIKTKVILRECRSRGDAK